MRPEAIGEVVGLAVNAATAPLIAEIAALRERLSVIEKQAPIVGPPGADGAPGPAGPPGSDGLGFEDLAVTFDDERTITLTFARGHVAKSFPIELPFLRYRGVFAYGTEYRVGDVVTHGGSSWHCHTPTALPPRPELREWSLLVRRGQDLRDREKRGES